MELIWFEAEIVADSLRMPLIIAQPATNYFRNIFIAG